MTEQTGLSDFSTEPNLWLSLKNFVLSDEPHARRLHYALGLAILLHLSLAILLPNLPPLKIIPGDSGVALNVFLKQAEPDQFEQELRQNSPLPAELQTDDPLSLNAQSIEKGEDSLLSEETPLSESPNSDSTEPASDAVQEQGQKKPSIRFDLATIKRFADQEAQRFAKLYPREVERVARGFNSRRNYRRRPRVESFRDRTGDIYARAKSSAGDICFKQEREVLPSEFTTNTVFFFRCGKKPQRPREEGV